LLITVIAVFLIFGLGRRSDQIANGREHEYNENESDNMDPDLLRLPSGQGRSTEPWFSHSKCCRYMDVVEILSAPLPRHTRHLPIDAYLLSGLHGATWAWSATNKKTARTTGSTTLQKKIRPRIVRAVSPASA